MMKEKRNFQKVLTNGMKKELAILNMVRHITNIYLMRRMMPLKLTGEGTGVFHTRAKLRN
jgi:hypothetical protein